MFAAVRERFGVERDDHLKLREFPTLTHVIGWITDKVAAVDRTVAAERLRLASSSRADRRRKRAAIGLRPTAARGAFRCPSCGRLWICACRPASRCDSTTCRRDARRGRRGRRPGRAPDQARCARVSSSTPASDAEKLAGTLDGWLADGPVSGVYWLPALDDEGPLEAMDLAGWHEALRASGQDLYATMRRLYDDSTVPRRRRPGSAATTATTRREPPPAGRGGHRLREGLPARAARTPWSRRSTCPAGRDAAAVASLLVDETLRDPGCVEVGHADGLRWTVGLVERTVRPTATGHSRSARTASSSSPAPRAASSRRSPPTSPRRRAGRSTCSTSRRRRTRTTRTCNASSRTRTASSPTSRAR